MKAILIPLIALVFLNYPTCNSNLGNSTIAIQPKPGSDKKPQLPSGAVHRFGDLRFRHPMAITVLEVAPNGNTIAAGDYLGNIKIWNVATGQIETEMIGHKNEIHAMVFSTDGKKLVTASGRGDDDPERDNTIRMWDVDSGKEIRQLAKVRRRAAGLAISKDGKTLASSSDFEPITLWELETGKKTGKIPSQEMDHWSLNYSSDGRMLAGVTWSYQAWVWDVATGKIIAQTEKKQKKIIRAEFSADCKTLITACEDGTLHYWSLPAGKMIKEISVCSLGLTAMAQSPNGHLIAVAASDGFIRFIGAQSGKVITKTTIRLGGNDVKSLAWSPNNKFLFSGGWAGAVRIWDATTGNEVLGGTEPRGQIFALALPTPKLLLAECGAQLFLFDLPSFKPLARIQTSGLNDWRHLAVSPEGNLVAASDGSPLVELWDLKTRKLLKKIQTPIQQYNPSIYTVAFSADGTHILSAGSGGIHGWDAKTGDSSFRLQFPKHDIRCMAVASQSSLVVTGGGDECVRIWDLTKKTQIWASPEPKRQFRRSLHAVAISPKGEWVAASPNDVGVTLWDAARRQPTTFQVPSAIGMMKSSADGKYLFIGTYSGTLCRYEPATGKLNIRHDAHRGSITDIVVDPEGNFLVSTAREGSTYYWDMKGLFPPGEKKKG